MSKAILTSQSNTGGVKHVVDTVFKNIYFANKSEVVINETYVKKELKQI